MVVALRAAAVLLPLRKEVGPLELLVNIVDIVANILTVALAILAFRKKK